MRGLLDKRGEVLGGIAIGFGIWTAVMVIIPHTYLLVDRIINPPEESVPKAPNSPLQVCNDPGKVNC